MLGVGCDVRVHHAKLHVMRGPRVTVTNLQHVMDVGGCCLIPYMNQAQTLLYSTNMYVSLVSVHGLFICIS